MDHSQKYRVGILLDSLVGGGAERIALNFAETFREMGHDAHVFILKNTVEHDTGSTPVHVVTETGQLSPYRFIDKPRMAKQLVKTIAAAQANGAPFDFFISNSEHTDRLSKLAGLHPVIIRYRNSMRDFLNSKIGKTRGLKRAIRTWRWSRKFQNLYSDRFIVTVSKAMELEILQDIKVKPTAITTIYNPFNAETLRTRADEITPEIPSSPYILYAARLSERKNQALLIRAYAQANVPEKLVLLGGTTCRQEEEYEKTVLALIKELNLEDKVLLPGFRKNPYPWIKNAKLFAMSSNSEGLPTVLIESLILGVPVVSTDCPTGPSEILTGPLAQFLSPIHDITKLAENIRLALSSYPAINDQTVDRFQARNTISAYIKFFEEVILPSKIHRNPN